MNWDDHRYFLAIARAGTLTGAARLLAVSQPTVTRRLKAMESRLGARLFERRGGGYALTSLGNDLLGSVERVEEELADAERRVFGKDERVKGALRITCTEIFLNSYLSPHLWRFLRENQGIELSLACTDSRLSLSRSDADIALRFTQSPPESMAGRQLAVAAYGVYGPSGMSATVEVDANDPASWPWIGVHDDLYNRLLFSPTDAPLHFRHQVDSVAGIQSMVRAGLGVSMLPCYVADRDPGLRRLDSHASTAPRLDLWMLYHPRIRQSPRVRLFADFVSELVHADADLFEGRRPQPAG